MSLRVELPPALNGGSDAKLQQLYGYLFRMAEQLNVALDGISSGGGSTAAAAVYKPSALAGSGTASYTGEAGDELRALIVNTAEIIRSEMDALRQTLRGEYTAMSDRWGIYREQMENTITATAEAVVQQYGFAADIETLEEQAAGFSRYCTETQGYIRQGFVERDSAGVPILGIAIGQGLTGVETVVDGQTVLELDPTRSCAFYTAERVSFRINGQEVAYLSNRKLYVADVEVTGRLTVGSWLLEDRDGLTVKFIG